MYVGRLRRDLTSHEQMQAYGFICFVIGNLRRNVPIVLGSTRGASSWQCSRGHLQPRPSFKLTACTSVAWLNLRWHINIEWRSGISRPLCTIPDLPHSCSRLVTVNV